MQETDPPPDVKRRFVPVIANALRDVAEGETKLVWVASRNQKGETKANIAIAHRIGENAQVDLWFGGEWGTPEATGWVVGTSGEIKWEPAP
jgi:hypothetical protein